GCVLQIAPRAPGEMVEIGGDTSEILAKLVGGPKPAASSQDGAEIFGQSFVDPQQISLHRNLVVGGGESGGAAGLAIPRVNIFVGKKRRIQLAVGFIDETAFAHAAVVGFVVLESEVGDVVAQRV